MSIDVLSPELVLVDPVLAARARLELPDPSDCLALASAAPVAPIASPMAVRHRLWVTPGSIATCATANEPLGTVVHDPTLARALSPGHPRVNRRLAPAGAPSTGPGDRQARPSLLAIVVGLFVALAIGLPSFDLVPWVAAERPSFVEGPEVAGADSVVLEWPKVEGANLYNVVLWRDGRRVLDLWPDTNRIDVLGAASARGRVLRPGGYQWFAFAGFGSPKDVQFGKPLANGSFSVPQDQTQP